MQTNSNKHIIVYIVKRLRRAALYTFAVIGLLMVVFHLCFDLSVIITGSMAPTLKGDYPEIEGDWVLSENISYWFRSPRRWEVISFRNKEGNIIMKRVVGMPSEEITVNKGEVIADGRISPAPEELDFLSYIAYGNIHKGKEFHCNRGYYVLGDYSKDSGDSRFDGAVETEQIQGRAWLRVWPLDRIGFVNP